MTKTQDKKPRKAKKKVLRFVFFGVASFAFIIYFFSVIFDIGMKINGKYKEKDELNNELNELKEKEEELSTDVLKLQDPEYVGRYLREKYFYSKSDEFIIKLPN